MKKLIALLLALTMVLAFAGCAQTEAPDPTDAPATGAPATEPVATEAPATEPAVTVMTYEEFMAAAADAEVTVETYVQAGESWWEGKVALYCQGPDGAYYLYGMTCTEEEAAKLVPGTKIRATGVKAIWNGEVEIMDGTIEIIEGADGYIADATDVTALMGTEDLAANMNKLVAFKGLTVAASNEAGAAYLYKWDGSGAQGDDLYFSLTDGTNTITFTVNVYMLGTGADSDVYKTIEGLQVGDKVDVEGFLYWYESAEPHVTSLTVVE